MNLFKKMTPRIASAVIVAVSLLLLFLIVAAGITPARYDLRAGGVAPITITATKDVEDVRSTQMLVDQAMRSVQPSYIGDASVQPQVLADLQEAFNRLLQMKARMSAVADDTDVTREELDQAAAAFFPGTPDDDVLEAFVRTDADALSQLYERAYALVREALAGKVSEGQEPEAIAKIRRDLINEDFDEALTGVASAVITQTLRPNMLLDEATTQKNREAVAAEIAPVIYKKGQNIVRSGEVVTQNQIDMLNTLGMLVDQDVDVLMYVGLFGLLLLLVMMVMLYIRTFAPYLLDQPKTIALLFLIVLITAAISWLMRMVNPFLMPVSLTAMLTALLIKPRLAIVTNILISVVSGLLVSVDTGPLSSTIFTVLLVSVLSGTICVSVIQRRVQRSMILLTGLIVAAINLVATLTVGVLNSASERVVLPSALWAAGSGALSAVLSLGFQPALEWLFNLVTPTKLMEISSPTHPLLRRLLLEAPGTYHHSILVANLAEAAANAIGANGLLARVGAYYHDVGKLKRPLYFGENQMNDNPHDRTDPRVSTAILTAHTIDGAEMAAKARIPEGVRDIIAQHHGDTPVLFFYDKAVKQGLPADIADFRYKGPRPQTREAAIVMLADTVEAAARAMPDPTPEHLSQLIQRMIRAKIDDGQLDQCPLTLADIERIRAAFVTVLIGIYHERVEYPNVKLPDRELNHLEAEAQAISEKLKQEDMAKPQATKPKVPKPEAPKSEAPKPEAPKPDASKPEAPKPEAPKPEAPKPDAPKSDASKSETPKPEAPKPDASKPEAPKPEAPKPDAPKPEASKPEAPKPDASKPDAPKPEAPELEQPMPEIATPVADEPAEQSAEQPTNREDMSHAD